MKLTTFTFVAKFGGSYTHTHTLHLLPSPFQKGKGILHQKAKKSKKDMVSK
jgi:hypothetical protein